MRDELRKSSFKRQRDLANSIPTDFPDINIVNLYLDPAINQHDIHRPAVSGNPASISLLAVFAEEHFVWGDTAGILKHFTDDILPGLAMRQLLHAGAAGDLGLSGTEKNCPLIEPPIHLRRVRAEHAPELRLTLKVDIALSVVRGAIKGTRNTPATNREVDAWFACNHRVWLPEIMVSRVFPALVRGFKGGNTSSTQKSASSISSTKFQGKLYINLFNIISLMLRYPADTVEVEHETIDLTMSSPEPEDGEFPLHACYLFRLLTLLFF